MKKSLLILSAAVMLFSCKKEKTASEFSQTDVTGSTVVKGSVSKNVITSNGAGGWINTTRVPVAGVNVSIKINKSSLYPGSGATGADVYTATTDNQGNYSVSVKTNATGAQALITIDGFSGTLDTLVTVNGIQTTKTGLYATYAGTSASPVLFMGSNYVMNHQFNATNLSTSPNNINVGSAIITGSISQNIVRSVVTGTNPAVISTTNIPVPDGTVVYMNFSNDPTLLATKQYTTTTSNGYYTFTFPTVAAGTPGFSQNATIWVNDRAATRDTLKIVGTTITGTVTGLPGVFGMNSTNQNGVYNNEIRNATHFSYGGFTPN